MMRDLGVEEIPLQLHTDSAAAIGIASRTGLGKLRHLQVHLLWVQQHVRNKVFELLKVPGKENPADFFTKHLAQADIDDHLHRLKAVKREGRADSAPATLSASLITAQARERVGSACNVIGENSCESPSANTLRCGRIAEPVTTPSPDHGGRCGSSGGAVGRVAHDGVNTWASVAGLGCNR